MLASREILREYTDSADLEISDALDRVREAGKVYIYPNELGWELSGHYRRPGERMWHDYLMALDGDLSLLRLSVKDDDPALNDLAAVDTKFSTSQ